MMSSSSTECKLYIYMILLRQRATTSCRRLRTALLDVLIVAVVVVVVSAYGAVHEARTIP
jgi:hypothetical protein